MGERVILPEAALSSSSGQTVGLFSEAATQKLSSHLKASAKPEKPVIRQANSGQHATTKSPDLIEIHGSTKENVGIYPDLPDPLPDLTQAQPPARRMIRLGLGVASTASLISGIILLMQSQTILHRTGNDSEKITATAAPAEETSMITDRVEQTAKAPTNRVPAQPPQTTPPATTPPATTRVAVAPVAATTPASSATSVTASATAPGTAPITTTSSADHEARKEVMQTPITLQIRVRGANLHTGPGIGFPVIGSAMIGSRFQASEWSDRWFKVMYQKTSSTTDVAWIRNDLVQVVSQNRVATPDVNPLRE